MHIKIFICTENDNKLKEYEALFKNRLSVEDSIELIRWMPSSEIEEIQSLDRNKIVLRKLNDVFQQFHLDFHLQKFPNMITELNYNADVHYWLMVEDTSFCIDNMNGFPGPFVKFFLNSLPNWKICSMNMKSKAQSIVSLGIGKILYSKPRNSLYLGYQTCLEGSINGSIPEQPRGTNGFGYDPIFVVDSENKTYAEMTMEEKNRNNARLLAVNQLMSYIPNFSNNI